MPTVADVMLKAYRELCAPDDPERIYVEWLCANLDDLHAATLRLGITPPEPGEDLAERLKAAVLPALMNLRHHDSL